MQKPTLDREELFARAQQKYADTHGGERANNVLVSHAVDHAVTGYASAEGRSDFLARISSARATLGPREGQPTVISQEVLDILSAVRAAAEEMLAEWN